MADTYTVQKGDTLSGIAKKLGMKLSDLIKYNAALVKDPNKIKIGWQLKLNDGPPPEKAGGPIQGKGGRGYTVSYEPNDKPEFKPKEVNPESPTGRKAGAPLKEDKWRKGKEIFDEVKTPVQIAVPAKPPAPTPAPPEPSMWDRFGQGLKTLNAWTDPVKVLSGHAGEVDYQPNANDYLGTALMGFGGGMKPTGVPLPSARAMLAERPTGAGAPYDAPVAESPVVNEPPPGLGPTMAMRARTEAAIRAKEASAAKAKNPQFPPGSWRGSMDDLAGLSNVRSEYPYSPELPAPTGDIGPAPVGMRERTIEAPAPRVVRASEMRTWQDVRNALRSASDNTVVVDGASDHGFTADQVVIMRGTRVPEAFDPQKALDSIEPPVLNQGMYAKILQYLAKQ